MLCYIFLLVCCVKLNNVVSYPKYISTSTHISELQKKLFKPNFLHPELTEARQPLPSYLTNPSIENGTQGFKQNQDKKDLISNMINEKRKPTLEFTDVIQEIKSHRFIEAQITLRKLSLLDKIPEFVHSVYNNSIENADLLLDFVRSFPKTGEACSVLFALWNEIKASGHCDAYKMVALVNAIELQLLKLTESSELKSKADLVRNESVLDIKNSTMRILQEAIESGKIQTNTETTSLTDSFSELVPNHKVFDDIFRKLSNESFPEISATQIAQSLYSLGVMSQAITGIQELFEKLEKSNNLNSPAVFNIAEYLRNLKNTPSYINLSITKKQSVELMIQKMPLCVRNLFFEPFVCIWNKGRSEYLYAASSEFNRNEDKRSVFTRTTREAIGPGIWIVEKTGDEFFFRSIAYKDEYLFAANGMHSKDSRFVHTWTEGGKVGNKSSWKIELNGDVCFIRNVNYDEYLFASDRLSGDKSRYAFTWIPRTVIKNETNFQWQIRNCDLSKILRKSL